MTTFLVDQTEKQTPLFCLFCFYRPYSKDGEGNVFSLFTTRRLTPVRFPVPSQTLVLGLWSHVPLGGTPGQDCDKPSAWPRLGYPSPTPAKRDASCGFPQKDFLVIVLGSNNQEKVGFAWFRSHYSHLQWQLSYQNCPTECHLIHSVQPARIN